MTRSTPGRLTVIEEPDACLVVREDDPDDWLARFEKSDQFPARAWAENMARIYNQRMSGEAIAPPVLPGTRPSNWHPQR